MLCLLTSMMAFKYIMSGPSYSADDKEAALKEVDAAGFPRCNIFTASQWTPQLH